MPMNLDTSHGHPAMDYREHVNTYRGFINGMFYGSIAVIAILIFMAVTLL
jgi:cobalamin biosynthesis protein CbiG